MEKLDLLHPAVTAADYVIAALGAENSKLLLVALRAGWLTADEAERLQPLAQGIAQLLEVEMPVHRGYRKASRTS